MNCKNIQDKILTDYLDGAMTEKQSNLMEEHIIHCAECRAFEAAARKTVAEPFEHALLEKTPDAVWLNIKESIEQGPQKNVSPLIKLIESWKQIFTFSFPRYVLASAALVFLIAVFIMPVLRGNQIKIAQEQNEDLMYFESILLVEDFNDNSNGYETDIEQYFL